MSMAMEKYRLKKLPSLWLLCTVWIRTKTASSPWTNCGRILAVVAVEVAQKENVVIEDEGGPKGTQLV